MFKALEIKLLGKKIKLFKAFCHFIFFTFFLFLYGCIYTRSNC